MVLLLLVLGAYLYWDSKGKDFIQGALQSKVSQIDIPSDSIVADYEKGEMMIYNARLSEYLFSKENSHRISASKIKMNGIDWLTVNTTKHLKVDTLWIFLDSMQIDYETIDQIEQRSNDMIREFSVKKVLVDMQACHISNIPQVENAQFSNGLAEINKLNFKIESREMSYEDPKAELLDAKTYLNSLPVYVKSVEINEKNLALNQVFYKDKSSGILADLTKLSTTTDLKNDDGKVYLKDISINAKNIQIPDKFQENNQGFDELHVGKIAIKAKEFKLISAKNKAPISTIKKLQFNSKNLRFSDKFSLGEYMVKAGSSELFQVDEFFVKTGGFAINPAKINISDLYLKSKRNRTDLARNSHLKNTIYDVEISQLEMAGNVVEEFRKNNLVKADFAKVSGARMSVYTDMNANVPKRTKKMLNQILKDLPIAVHIPEIKIENSYVKYDLKAERREDVGSIFVSQINGNIRNFTNTGIELDPLLRSNFSGLLMGKGPLKYSLELNLKDDQNSYKCQAEILGMEAQDVNRMLEDLTAVRIRKGEMHELSFDFSGNKYRTQGSLEFYYENLKLMHVEERSNGVPDVFRALINNFILRQNNRKGRSPKIASVNKQHEPEQSHFRRIWEGVFDGLEKTLLPKLPKNPLKPKG